MHIDRFRGEHFYLSNMYPLEHWVKTREGIDVPTTEHAYQADKLLDYDAHFAVATARAPLPPADGPDERSFAESLDGLAAKHLAHALIAEGAERVPGWDEVKVGVMYELNLAKFKRNYGIAALLINTGTTELVEGNDWDDRFWGVDPPGSTNGANNLGKVLMRVRAVLCASTS